MIVLVVGNKRHGKGSVASCLVKNHGYTELTLAAPVKEAVRMMNPYLAPNVRVSDLDGLTDDEIKATPYADEWRRLLMHLGTEVRDQVLVNPYLWCDLCYDKIIASTEVDLVISDVRFVHEVEYFKRKFGVENVLIVRVYRPTEPVDTSHESEAQVSRIMPNVVIYNDSSLEELCGRVDVMMEHCAKNTSDKVSS